jgi:hypothetical protein
MSSLRLQLLGLLALVLAMSILGACGSTQRPQLKVLGIEQTDRPASGREIKLFVEVTNYAKRPMHLQRLEYQFGPSGSHADEARGQVSLSRTVEAGSAVVVEVPILVDADLLDGHDLELRGQLITEQDQILRSYPVKSPVADASP